MYDLIVVGGGPGGAASAITAARLGARVLLVERGQFPRQKVCGEFLSAESLQLLASLLSNSWEWHSLVDRSLRVNRGRLFIDDSVLETSIAPQAASIARLDLDMALWQAALNAGVDARQQETVREIQNRGPFTIRTSSGTFQARCVINASGRWSNLKGKDRQSATQPKWLGIKAHFAEFDPSSSVDLYFFTGGYCGVQPVRVRGDSTKGRINVCAMVRADLANSLSQVFALHTRLRERSLRWQQVSKAVATSPLIFRQPQSVTDNVLMAGDAAGFVDPFVGDGISLALRSGVLAAESFAKFFAGKCTLTDSAESYSETYKSRLLPVFRSSSKIRRLFALPAPLRAGVLVLFENAPQLTRYLMARTR